jgi:hypothetical protein
MSKAFHTWNETIQRLYSPLMEPNGPPSNAELFARLNSMKPFRRFRVLCEAIGFKPPDGASEAKVAVWWLNVLAMPEDYHDKIWRMFADRIAALPQAEAETIRRSRVAEACLAERENRSNATIAQLAKDRTRLMHELKSQKGATDLPKFSRAMAQLVAHPDWTNSQIADAAGCHVKSLSRMPLFRAARESLKEQGKAAMFRGSKRRKQNSEQASVEAWNEPEDDDAR